MEIGLMINNMGLEWSHGQTEPNTRVPTLMVKRRVKENLHLLMAVIMKASLNKMRYAVMENISGLTVNNMKDSGVKIKCMEKVL